MLDFFNWPRTEFDAVPNQRRFYAPSINWRKERWGPYIKEKEDDSNNKIEMPDNGNNNYDDYDYEGDGSGNENEENPYGQNPMYRQDTPPRYNRPFYGIISRKTEFNQQNSSIPFI